MHFDWSTLILQTINVLVLLWLLRRFLFRPVAAIIAQRQAAAEKLLADAAAATQSRPRRRRHKRRSARRPWPRTAIVSWPRRTPRPRPTAPPAEQR